MKKTLHEQTVLLGKKDNHGARLPIAATEILFRPCPFCGSIPDVFQVPEKRYGENAPWSWNIECPNMGCLFTRPETGDQSLQHLAERWNYVVRG